MFHHSPLQVSLPISIPPLCLSIARQKGSCVETYPILILMPLNERTKIRLRERQFEEEMQCKR